MAKFLAEGQTHKNPPVRRRVHIRRRRDTNYLYGILTSILRNKIVSAGGGKPVSVEKFRQMLSKIVNDKEYWETLRQLITIAKKLNTNLDLY